MILKAKKAKEDPLLAILEFRNTPSQHINVSPTQRLFNRKTKTLLPTTTSALMFQPKNYEEIYEKRKDEQERMARYYNRNARQLPVLYVGEAVRYQPEKYRKEWRSGEITDRNDETGTLSRLQTVQSHATEFISVLSSQEHHHLALSLAVWKILIYKTIDCTFVLISL